MTEAPVCIVDVVCVGSWAGCQKFEKPPLPWLCLLSHWTGLHEILY